MRVGSLVCALALTVCAALLPAQSPVSPRPARLPVAPGRIAGLVYDSLLKRPIPRATVMLLSGTRTTTSDASGLFAFDSVAAGPQTVAFTAPSIDSLGFGTLGAAVTVVANETTSITLATPSLRALWRARCNNLNTIGADSGIVWGIVRDAHSNAAADSASAAFYWVDLNAGVAAGFRFGEHRRETRADASGIFFACGLPVAANIATEGMSANAASARVQYTLGPRRVQHLDLLVSAEMAVPANASRQVADSLLKVMPRGTATLRGTVRDDRLVPVANATVKLVAADTSARTDSLGRFTLGRLPAGTQTVEVRRVGGALVSKVVELRPGDVTSVSIEYSNVTTLAATKVVGRSKYRTEYDERRDKHLGTAIDSAVLDHKLDLFAALENVPLMQVTSDRDGKKKITLRNLGTRSKCDPLVYLDGLPSKIDQITRLAPSHFRAIEILPAELTPLKYTTSPPSGCGVMLFWSVNTSW